MTNTLKTTGITLLLLLLTSFSATAQETTDAMDIDAVFEACALMQEALENNDTAALARAAAQYRQTKATTFSSLRCKDDTLGSLDGHFVFNDVFVDSLQTDTAAYLRSENISRSSVHRGQTANGAILTKTCFVAAGKTTRYSFPSRGPQELGVITEPGGLVYVRVHATNRKGLDEWHNDSKNAARGTRRYKTVFNLPKDVTSRVELEVVNKGKKNISFVVISNR